MEKIKEIAVRYLHRLNTGTRLRVPERQPLPAAAPSRGSKYRPAINLALFIATCYTTTYAGAQRWDGTQQPLLNGLPYSIPLMALLLSHEFGHYFAARRFGVNATLPFFIPFFNGYLFNFGTMGAVIATRSPIPHRRALFYLGVMGPLSGFLVSLAVFIYGIYISPVKPLPLGMLGHTLVFGDSLLVTGIIRCIHGTLPKNHDVYLSLPAMAGWFGFLITSLNLMPIGQLDGSHILYALVGRRQIYFGWAAVACLALLAFFWPGWIVWIVLTFVMLMVAHPPVPEVEPLSPIEKAVGWLCMIIFIITFVPMPLDFL